MDKRTPYENAAAKYDKLLPGNRKKVNAAVDAALVEQGIVVYTGYPGETFVSMSLETGKIGQGAIYIGQHEPDPGAAYRRALGYLEKRIKEAASSAANTGDGKAEQITTPVSASILTDEKEDCKRW